MFGFLNAFAHVKIIYPYYNKMHALKKANYLRKMPKIKLSIEKMKKNGSGGLKIECNHMKSRVHNFFTM